MITFSALKKKRYRTTLLAFVFIIIMALAALIDGSYEDYSKSSAAQLGLVKEQTFPLSEISGMYLFPSGKETPGKIYLIGDTTASLGIAQWDGKKLVQREILDFSQAILNKWGICQSSRVKGCVDYLEMITSQWEGVTSDATGRAFLLHEQLGTIFVLDPDASQILSLINLEAFSIQENRRRYRSTVNKENAMGEGLLLLKNGHILVIKERFEPTIIEFGPAGSQPQGYQNELWTGASGEFPISGEQYSLYPLMIWHLDKKFQNCDLSELSPGPAGDLYILSQQCKWVARLTDLKPDAPKINFANLWALPSKIRRAEAFIVPDEQHIIVAEDKKSLKKPNIFLLAKPESPRDTPSLPPPGT